MLNTGMLNRDSFFREWKFPMSSSMAFYLKPKDTHQRSYRQKIAAKNFLLRKDIKLKVLNTKLVTLP